MFTDLKFALRTLVKSPGFTAIAVLVLALGIGANTAIFSIVNAFLFHSLPVPEPGRLYQIYSQDKKAPDHFRSFSYPTYTDLRSSLHSFSSVLAHNLCMVGVGDSDATQRTFAGVISSNYFSTLGVTLAQGRAFLPEEEDPGRATPVAIVSYSYWVKHDRNPGLIGQTIRLNNRVFTIVGVAPQGFTGTMTMFAPEFWVPLGVYDQVANDFAAEGHRQLSHRDAYNVLLVGRLAPGVSPAAADAELAAVAARMEKSFPVEQKNQTFLARPLPHLGTSTSPVDNGDLSAVGALLLGMAAIVLLISCLNLASMLLARGTARRKEFAIRLAIGGSRWQIVRQLLTEGFLLALLGGVGGLLIAAWSSDLLVASLRNFMPLEIVFSTGPDYAVFAAALGFCLLGTLLFALGPALKSSRADVVHDLKEQSGEDQVTIRRKWLPRNPLVVLQVALSLALLTAAGLFIRSAFKAADANPGFTIANQAVIETDASLAGYPEARARELYRALGDRLTAIPGVESASIGSVIPFGLISLSRNVQRAGVTTTPGAKPATAAEGLAFTANWNSIGADYFKTLGLPLRAGRTFTKEETDAVGAPHVAIVDEVLAKKLWPEGNAIGQRLQYAERDAPSAAASDDPSVGVQVSVPTKKNEDKVFEVVGIAANSRNSLFEKNPPGHLYVPFSQGYQPNVHFHVRKTLASPAAEAELLAAIRREVRAVDPQLPILGIKTMAEHMDASDELWIVRAGAMMFSAFGGLALFLAVIGIYGVKAYSVARRTREIGIRMALGARPDVVLWMILREGLVMTLTGTALGLLLAAGVARLVSGLLYDVGALDPVVFILVPLLLASAALLACWVPARRATKITPMTALRTE